MVPYIRALAVSKRGWVSEAGFRLGMAVAQSIPGATAMQAAAYAGLRARGVPGALAAYAGFGLPAFAMITTLSLLYFEYGHVSYVARTFGGLKIIVVALVAHASFDFSTKLLQTWLDRLLALAAGLVFAFRGSPVLAILGVCLAAMVLYRDQGGQAGFDDPDPLPRTNWALLGCVTAALAGGALALRAMRPELFSLAVIMAKVDCFAFGGGYVSLPIMLHEVVGRGWMSGGEFLDGLALGQLTPGPIVMTASFVGYKLAGVLGAFVGAVYVFAPSFLLITILTPHFERFSKSVLFQRALRGSLMSLVGLMAATTGVLAMAAPWSPLGGVLFLGAFIALRMKADVLHVAAAGAILSLIMM